MKLPQHHLTRMCVAALMATLSGFEAFQYKEFRADRVMFFRAQGLRDAEIAARMGTNEDNVRSLARYARKRGKRLQSRQHAQ